MSILIDPYRGAPSTTRLQSRIADEDHLYLKTLLIGGNSTVQLVVNHLVRHIVQTFRKHGIRDYKDIDRANAILAEYDPNGRAPGCVVGGKTGGNVRRKPKSVRAKDAGESTEPADASRESEGHGCSGGGPE